MSSDEDDTKAVENVDVSLDFVQDEIKVYRKAAGKDSDALMQRRRLKTLHFCSDLASGILACGRNFESETHSSFPCWPAFPFPRCKDCFWKEAGEPDVFQSFVGFDFLYKCSQP